MRVWYVYVCSLYIAFLYIPAPWDTICSGPGRSRGEKKMIFFTFLFLYVCVQVGARSALMAMFQSKMHARYPKI
jgi:hypothetical protein